MKTKKEKVLKEIFNNDPMGILDGNFEKMKKLTTGELEYFYRIYELNPMSSIMSRLMDMTNSKNHAIQLMEQVEEYITKKDLNEI